MFQTAESNGSMTAVASFLGGLSLLLIAGHFVVSAATALGKRFGLTPTVIGLTIVAAGTSAPELAVVGQAIANDDTALAVGSIIGSNIANVLLVLGLVAAFGTIAVTSRLVRVDIPIMIAASIAFLVMSLDGQLVRIEGVLLLLALVAFVTWTLRSAPRDPDFEKLSPELTPVEDPPANSKHSRLPTVLATLAVGIAGLALAASFVVAGAEEIATNLGVPELVIGLTIVALGTSAPEIVTSVVAALRGHRDLAVGNAVGSNIFNILLVLGATTTLSPRGIEVGTDAARLDLPILVAAAVACLPLVFWDHKLDRWEGALFVAYYLAYLAFLTLDATGHQAKDRFMLVMLAFVMPLTLITAGVAVNRQRNHAPASKSSHPSPPNRSPTTEPS